MENLFQLSDEELIKKSTYNQDATTQIIIRYTKIVFHIANSYADFINETDDLKQEGLLGLVNAVSTFNFSKGVKFSTYANSCITNRMTNYINKNIKNNTINNIATEEFNTGSPESIVIEKEKFDEFVQQIIKKLSEFEWNVFCLFLTGSEYDEIATQLCIPVKSVDNAMQRVRQKLKQSKGTEF